jgi:5-methylcytosine-specific restriction endonuclease McrA
MAACSDGECIKCFKMPAGITITGRSSSIRNVFVAAIIPVTKPAAAEIRAVLEILQMKPDNLRCSYCGDRASEWDHLRPLVEQGKPTGFPSSIKNLVPSCGKCNQSKGKSDWKVWMRGNAPQSPKLRGVPDLEDRISRLDQYEKWAECKALDIQNNVDRQLWDEYYALQAMILQKMREAQGLAETISAQLTTRLAQSRATTA